ncbi:unnamed protein product [Larinioides sclopetarius]|uniref:P-type domain-containing protein n=1 Tax=Larinioides sclopetarius TaxID=280406 RepID=A0AAV2B165_9ARAC
MPIYPIAEDSIWNCSKTRETIEQTRCERSGYCFMQTCSPTFNLDR